MLVTYGNRVLTVSSGGDLYAARYKGIWICMTILARALSGNYVNFGVFDLYGDPALKVRGRWCGRLNVALSSCCGPPRGAYLLVLSPRSSKEYCVIVGRHEVHSTPKYHALQCRLFCTVSESDFRQLR